VAEEIHVARVRLLEAINSLERRKPPKNPLYLERLRSSIETSADMSVSITKMVTYLACAGYDMKDIIQLLFEAGIVSQSDDILIFRDGIRRVILTMKCE